jgi:hypothetical protein
MVITPFLAELCLSHLPVSTPDLNELEQWLEQQAKPEI